MAGVLGYGLFSKSQAEAAPPQDGKLYHIGIETGGTTCKVGIMHGAKSLTIIKRLVVETTTPKETVKKLCAFINEQEEVFASVGIAAFGPLCLDRGSPSYGSVTTTPKLAWQHAPLLRLILDGIHPSKKGPGFRVAFDTDVNLLAMFELENGGHTGVTDYLAYITVGTGVGVGFVVNGKCIHGMIHPEGGHVVVPALPQEKSKYNFEGVCPFHRACIEGLCTNVAIAKRLGLASVDEVPGLPDDHEVWDMVGHYLGTMCANLTLTMSLNKIVIGGGVMNRGEVLFEKIRAAFATRLADYLDHE